MKRWMTLLLTLFMLMTSAAAKIEYRHPVTDGNLSVQEGLNPDWTNILLLGADTREDEENDGRSDVMLICSLNRETGAVRLTSLSRDMWVRIAGTEHSDRINTAFRYGGPDLAMKTVNEVLQRNIEQYVAVNFYGVCDVVDAIGGIELELSKAEVGTVNRTVNWKYGSVQGERLVYQEGKPVTLCGAQALSYARIRKLDNDLGRNSRQRNVIMAVARKTMGLSLGEQMAFVKTCLEHVTTNLSLTDIMTMGFSVLSGGLEDMEQLALPTDFSYANEDGRSVLHFDKEQARRELHGFVYDAMPPVDDLAEQE